ncbi:MAG: hypothetical protein P4L90_12120, partial [Rhodopila sp.]|nr:hypothetical protein [Rhodopila sp.]
MMRDALLALGMVLAAASQMRIAGLPLGPGEFCLALWIVLTMGGQVIGLERPTKAFWHVMSFWAFFTIAQCLGTIWSVFAGVELDRGLFLHDVVAY